MQYINTSIIAVIALLIMVLVRLVTSRISLKPVAKAIARGASLPLQILVALLALTYIAELHFPHISCMAYGDLRQLLLFFGAIWVVIRSTRRVETVVQGARKEGAPIADQTRVELVGKLLIVVTLIGALIATLSVFGVDLAALLTIGGLGSVAIGLAGRDVFANLFSGFMLHMTQPFKIGDYVSSPDQPIDGVIDHIGWYTTRLITLDKKPTYVPNSLFSTATISNFARMSNRRLKETIGFRYADLDRLPPFLAELRALIQKHPDIANKEPIYCRLVGYGDWSLDVLVQAVTRSPAWDDFLRVREELFLKIADLASQYEIGFAFPTTTLDISQKKDLDQLDSG